MKNYQIVLLTIALVSCCILIIANPALAETLTLENPLRSADTIPEVINNVLTGVLGLVGAVALLMFVYGGFLWLTAMGEDKRVKQGWDTMTWAAIGIAVIFASYALVKVVFNALGVN